MYLTLYDYRKQIQAENLNQLISSDYSILQSAQLAAQSAATSFLTQKYLVSQEFTDTNQWNPSAVYKAADRVVLDVLTFPAYVPATAYVSGNLVSTNGNAYKCTASTTGVFDPSKWTLIGKLGDLFFCRFPQAVFDYRQYYQTGDKVFWKDKVYTALKGSILPSRETVIQFQTYESIPPANVFPDDPINGKIFWGAGVPYTVPAGTALSDTNFWTAGDNRDQLLVMYLVDITLYHITRIAARNIPLQWEKRYEAAMDWLNQAATGAITAALPVIQPKRGGRIRYGGNIKIDNIY